MRIGLAVAVLFLCLTPVLFAAEEVQSTLVPAPQVTTIVGNQEIHLGGARWPNMSSSSDNGDCDNMVGGMSGTLKPGASLTAYHDTDLKVIEYAIPEKYRETANVIVTWILRVEGLPEGCPNPWTDLGCNPYHGSNTCSFPDGEVRSRLYIDGKAYALDMDAIMTVPGLGTTITVNNPSDPTHSGSAVITPKFFSSGKFPPKIKLEVKWRNDSSMGIRSNAQQHSMEVMLIPIASSGD